MEHQVNDQVQQASLTSSNDIASKIDNVEKEKDKKNCSIPSCNDNDQSARPLNAEGSGNPTNAQPTTASTTTSDDDDEQRNIISLFHHLQHSGNMKLKLNNHHDITEQMNDPSNNHNNGNNNNNKAVRDDNNVVIAKTLANMSMKTIFHPDNLASPKGPFDRTIYSTNAIGVNDDDDDTTTINDDALMKSSSKPTLMSITTSLSRKSSSPRVQLDSDNNDDEDEDDDDDGPIDDEEDEVSDDEGNNDSNNGNGQPQDGGKLWSLQEDNILLQLQSKVGNRWSWIARKLPGRTENQIKTRFKSILRASKRMWTKAEDELLIAKQKQHRNDWVKIAQSFPKRTKNGVRVRFKQLLNIKLGAVEKSTPGSPRQALLSGYDSEIVDRKTWIKTSKLKNNNNNNNNTNSNNISNKSRSHDSDELSSTHSLKKRKLSSHSFASSNHNGKDSSMSPSQNRLNDVLINKVIARTPSSSQDTCDDKRESSSETESIAASATTSCSKSTNASTASSASLNSASSQASYGLVSPFQMLFSGPVTTASPNTTSPKVPQNQNIFLPANITGFINPVALNQPTQILLPVPQSSIPTLAAASVNTVPSGQIPFFAFLPITGANIQGDGANKLMPNMFSQVPLVAFPLNMAPGVNRPSPQLSSAQETNKS